MSESTRIIINAGGRIFETSKTTLLASGSGYFEGLLGSTGETMKGKKRARVSADAGDDAPAELFLDRDPDVFADVLKYMRANRLPAAVRADAHRLDDLKSEAEFFAYDRLVAACDEAQAALPHPEGRREGEARALLRAPPQHLDVERRRPRLAVALVLHVDVPRGDAELAARGQLAAVIDLSADRSPECSVRLGVVR